MKHEFYAEENNGKGYATLIKNLNKNNSKSFDIGDHTFVKVEVNIINSISLVLLGYLFSWFILL